MSERKTITVLIPTYNEEANMAPGYDRVTAVFRDKLPQYDYEIVYIDNCSTDGTRAWIEAKSQEDKHVRAIYNARNFGGARSIYYGLTQCTGDAVVLLFADMQDPPELIETFVKEWEAGAKVIVGVKTSSAERKLMYWCRSLYYWFIRRMSSTDQIEHCTGYGMYDKSFIHVLGQVEDSTPYLRGIIAELGYSIKKIPYKQDIRRFGKTSNRFLDLYDWAMMGITSYTKFGLRMVTFMGVFIGFISVLVGISTIIAKLCSWGDFPKGLAFISCAVCFMGALQLFFLGIMGEYILSINARTLKRPLVIEEKRVNW